MITQRQSDRIRTLELKYPIWRGYFRPDENNSILFVARPDGKPPRASQISPRLTGTYFAILHNDPDSFTKYPEGISASFYRFVPDSDTLAGFTHVAHHTDSFTLAPGLVYHDGILHGDDMARVIATTDLIVHPGLIGFDLYRFYADITA